MAEHFDAIVVGAGQAGPALAARLDREGLKTAFIERKLLGGTCVNTGCIPTKTLIASARAMHVARRGTEYGFAAGKVRTDMTAVKQRKDGVVRQSTDGLANWIGGMKHVELIRGHARFSGPRTIAVNGRSLAAERVFLNVGARASIPDMAGVHDVPFLTNSTMMSRCRGRKSTSIIVLLVRNGTSRRPGMSGIDARAPTLRNTRSAASERPSTAIVRGPVKRA